MIKKIKQVNKILKSIDINLLKIDLGKLLAIEIEDRSEKGMAEEVNSLLLNMNVLGRNDIGIGKLEIKRKR